MHRDGRSEAALVGRPFPTVQATACLAAGLALVRFGITAHGALAAFVAGVLVVLAGIDIERRILPNRIVLPSAAVVLVAQIVVSPERTAEWLLAALGASAFFFAAHAVYPAGLGFGDVKLAFLLGAALGAAVIRALVIGSLLAALVGAILIAREGSDARKKSLPFGPFLALGALVMLFIG